MSEQTQELRNWETEAGLVGDSSAGTADHLNNAALQHGSETKEATAGLTDSTGQKVNVFDFEVSSFEEESNGNGNGASSSAAVKEMTERAGSGLFNP